MTHSNTNEVSKPAHYTSGSKEAIEFVEAIGELEGFCLGNVIKYLYRYKFKGDPVLDLMKAREYLDRLINHVKKNRDMAQEARNNSKTHSTAYWKEKQELINRIDSL